MIKKLFSLFPWLNRGIDPNVVVGVATYANMVTAVSLKKQQEQWLIDKSYSIDVAEQDDYTRAIASCTNQVSRETCAVSLVLPHFFYQILQMDKPTLTDEEVIQSLPWTTKDLVNIAPENIVADFIDYPITQAMQSSKMNVFIANKLQLAPLINSFSETDAVLRSMTSEEMVLLTLFGEEPDAHMLVVQHVEHEPRILIIRDGVLLLVRRLNGFLGITDKDQSNALADALGLEIQRSMDFFESQLKQAPIRSVQLVCDSLSSLSLRAELAELLQIKVADFTANIPLAEQLEKPFHYALAAAVQLTQVESSP